MLLPEVIDMKNYERDVNYEGLENAYKFYMHSPIVLIIHYFLLIVSFGDDGISLFAACYFLYFMFYAFRWVVWTYAMHFGKDKEAKKIDWDEYDRAMREREEKIEKEYGTLDYQREHYDCYKRWREKHQKHHK